MKNAFDIVRDFEAALCEYTGAPYAVTTNSCTKALGLCFEYMKHKLPEAFETPITMPKYTYIGVPMQAHRLGYKIKFLDEAWSGFYRINPLNVFDAARRFNRNMFITDLNHYEKYSYMCLSFHYTKILNITQGGCILHNDKDFDKWARQMRFDGRDETQHAGVESQFILAGDHCYMGPEVAAQGLRKLNSIGDFHNDLPLDDYPDLSKVELFK